MTESSIQASSKRSEPLMGRSKRRSAPGAGGGRRPPISYSRASTSSGKGSRRGRAWSKWHVPTNVKTTFSCSRANPEQRVRIRSAAKGGACAAAALESIKIASERNRRPSQTRSRYLKEFDRPLVVIFAECSALSPVGVSGRALPAAAALIA